MFLIMLKVVKIMLKICNLLEFFNFIVGKIIFYVLFDVHTGSQRSPWEQNNTVQNGFIICVLCYIRGC